MAYEDELARLFRTSFQAPATPGRRPHGLTSRPTPSSANSGGYAPENATASDEEIAAAGAANARNRPDSDDPLNHMTMAEAQQAEDYGVGQDPSRLRQFLALRRGTPAPGQAPTAQSAVPTTQPTAVPTTQPTAIPTTQPTAAPQQMEVVRGNQPPTTTTFGPGGPQTQAGPPGRGRLRDAFVAGGMDPQGLSYLDGLAKAGMPAAEVAKLGHTMLTEQNKQAATAARYAKEAPDKAYHTALAAYSPYAKMAEEKAKPFAQWLTEDYLPGRQAFDQSVSHGPPASGNATSGTLTAETARQFLEQAKGDKTLARQLAQQAGWKL